MAGLLDGFWMARWLDCWFGLKKTSDDYRAIALVRHGFGGHPFGRDKYIAKERTFSRVEKM